MIIKPIKTNKFSFKSSLFNFLEKNISSLKEESLVFISSKIVSLSEGRYVFYENNDLLKENLKINLVKKEAERIYYEIFSKKRYFITKKNGLVILNAGIDPAYGRCFILYPKNPFQSAKKIHCFLKTKFNLKKIGVIIVDSKTEFFRKGKKGFSLGFYGISPFLKGTEKFGFSYNVVDSLSALVDCFMSLPDNKIPLVLIEDISGLIDFKEKNYKNKFFLSEDKDIFRGFPF